VSSDPLRWLAWLRAGQEEVAAGALAVALTAADRAAAEVRAARRTRRAPPWLASSAAALRADSLAGARLRARVALAAETSARASRAAGAAADAHRRARQGRALVEKARRRWEEQRRRVLERVAEANQDDRRRG